MYWWQPGMGMGVVESLAIVSTSRYRARLARRSLSQVVVVGRFVEHTNEDSIVVLCRLNEPVMKVIAGLHKLLQAHHFAGEGTVFRLYFCPMPLFALLIIWKPADCIRQKPSIVEGSREMV
jgi:hypothetical protein